MVRERIEELRRQLELHNFKYYVENAPEISDFEFDAMMRELQDLERAHPEYADPNSPSVRVGSDLTAEFRTVKHRYAMLSLGNTYSLDELHEFIGRIEREAGATDYVCELKFDGTAISLTYEHGRLVRAVTRGDGIEGDDVTANVRTVRTVPLRLRGTDWPDLFEIRGEILMPYASFDRLNAEREANGEQLFANPRNAAAGSLRQLDPKIAARRRLDIAVFNLQLAEGRTFSTHTETIDYLASQQFKTISYRRLRAGYHTVSVAGLDGYIYLQKSIPFDAGSVSTLAVILRAGGLDLLQISDRCCPPTGRYSNLRVSNLAYYSNPLDVLLADGRVIYTDVRFKETTSYKRIRPGTYEFFFAETNLAPIPSHADIETLDSAFLGSTPPANVVASDYVAVSGRTNYTIFLLSTGNTSDAVQALTAADR